MVVFCTDIQGEKKYILDLSDRTKDKKINDALDISRIESGKVRFAPVPVDIRAVCRYSALILMPAEPIVMDEVEKAIARNMNIYNSTVQTVNLNL